MSVIDGLRKFVLNADRYPVRVLARTVRYHPCALSVFQRIVKDTPHTLLLESSDIESKDNVRSLLLTHPALKVECQGIQVEFTALSANGKNLLPLLQKAFVHYRPLRDGNRVVFDLEPCLVERDEDEKLRMNSVLDGLRFFMRNFHSPSDNAAPLFGAGVLAYDLVCGYEPLPFVPDGFNDCPDYLFYIAETSIVIDHQRKTSRVISHVFSGESELDNAAELSARNKRIQLLCENDVVEMAKVRPVDSVAAEHVSDQDYCEVVEKMRLHIEAGDIFQAVPSRSFFIPCPNPFNAYRILKETNPSPYMFYLHTDRFVLFGASPESALKYHSSTNQVEIYPIAGTRRRGRDSAGGVNHDLDSRIELELRQDPKELAEHMMLVDLARNDIARICKPGTRRVPELLKVDRYSHVMHLVSRVTGQLKDGLDALHAYQACMNMGTLVGAPKVRAAQLIREFERERRGSYGGAVGYFNSDGDMDTCIVIRSAFVKNGVACVQAGAGVVYDSDAQSEADETRSKAQAVINAIQIGGGA